MLLTSITNIKTNYKNYRIIDILAYRSKSIYNSSLYIINEYYKSNNKLADQQYIYNTLKLNNPELFKSLPSQVVQQTIKSYSKIIKVSLCYWRKRKTNNIINL